MFAEPSLWYVALGRERVQPWIWALYPSGSSIEVQLPVYTTTSVTTTLAARVDTADGGFNFFATPTRSLFVPSNPPTVSYPQPSATLITDTTARTTADVFNHFTAGTLYFDIGTTTAYGTSSGGNAVSNTWNSGRFYSDWGSLSPGNTYHWRARFVPGAGPTVLGADQTFTTTGSITVPTVPQNVSATAAPGEITVTWSAVIGAQSYLIWRRGEESASYSQIGTSNTSIYHDASAVANKAYLYRVRAVNSAGSSADSAFDLATMIVFSDDPLTQGTVIKAVHLAELRTALTAVGALSSPFLPVFTDVAAPGLVIKGAHVTELRFQLDASLQALGIATSPYLDVIGAGATVKTYHYQQLRDRLK